MGISVGTAVLIGSGLSAVGGIIAASMNKSSAPQTPAAPPISAVPVMPVADSTQVQQAKQLAIAQQMQTQGRASTILTQQGTSNEKLGA